MKLDYKEQNQNSDIINKDTLMPSSPVDINTDGNNDPVSRCNDTPRQIKCSFFPNASSEWNKLPEQIVNSSSVILFKTNLQKYMLENHDSNCKICYNL